MDSFGDVFFGQQPEAEWEGGPRFLLRPETTIMNVPGHLKGCDKLYFQGRLVSSPDCLRFLPQDGAALYCLLLWAVVKTTMLSINNVSFLVLLYKPALAT